MTSAVEICNLALTNANAEGSIEALDPTLGEEERVCSLWYEPLRRQLITRHPWSFATKQLALTDTGGTPVDTRWAYMYQYPSDCYYMQRIINVADPDTPIDFVVIRDETNKKVILTNQDEALGEYTIDVTDPAEFDPQFVLVLSWWIAAHIAKPLTGSDDARDHAVRMFSNLMPVQQAKDANEKQDTTTHDASWIDARA